MPEQKYMLHSSEDCSEKRTNQNIVNDILGVHMVSRAKAVKQYKNFESKWKKYLKSLKSQNKMLFIIINNYVLRREIKKIKKIR